MISYSDVIAQAPVFRFYSLFVQGFPWTSTSRASLLAQTLKDLPDNAEDPGSIPELERSPGEGNGYPLQYSCLENPMYRGACSDEAEMPLMGSCNPAS